jgi:hypothetical protein
VLQTKCNPYQQAKKGDLPFEHHLAVLENAVDDLLWVEVASSIQTGAVCNAARMISRDTYARSILNN